MDAHQQSTESGLKYKQWAKTLLVGLAVLLPVMFLPMSLDVLSLNKQTILVLLTLGGALLWLVSMLVSRTFTFRRGWLNLFPLVFLLVVVASAFSSSDPYASWVGSGSLLKTSFLSVLGFVVLFFVVTNVLDSLAWHKRMHMGLLISATTAGAIGVLSLFGMTLPFDFAQGRMFNTVGTVNGFGVYMAVMTVFASALWVAYKTKQKLLYDGTVGVVERVLIFMTTGLGFLSLLVIDYWVLWAVLIVGLLVLFGFAFMRMDDFSHTQHFILPALMLVVGCVMVFWVSTPINANVPVEVSPSFETSKSIATQTLEENALLGSGPGTFVYDFTQYRPLELNETQFWNTRFDQSPYFFLTATATLGVLGVFFWILFLLVTGVSAVRAVLHQDEGGRWLTMYPLLVAWAAVAVSGFVYSSNMTLMFLLFLFSGLLASRMLRETYTHAFDDSPGMGLAFSFGAVLTGFILITLIFISGQRYLAESAYANAIRMSRGDADIRDVIGQLDRATRFNRFNDLYYRNISQAFLIQIKDEIDNIQQAQDVSAEKRQYVQDLTGASIDAAKRATDLAPNNALNWRTRGQVYRELIPLVKNADKFAVEAFERAAQLDPNNPTSFHELGKTYLAIAENTQQLTAAQDKAVREQAESDVDRALKKAEGNFQKAIERKSDHAPAHYQLGLVFEQQGRIDDAIGKMESVTQYNKLDVGAKFQTGVLYLRRGNEGDLDRARKQFEEVIQLAPAYSNARWYLASIYEQTGELDKAVAQVEKVLELNPENRLVKTRLERLKRGETTDELPDAVDETGGTEEADPLLEDEKGNAVDEQAEIENETAESAENGPSDNTQQAE